MAEALKQLSDEELVHRVQDGERDLVAARFRHGMNQLENTAELRTLRRNIARLRTEARAREIDRGLRRDSLLSSFGKSAPAAAEGAADASAEQKGGFLSGIVDKLSGKE